ncbi:N-acyl-D-amino-acid deacylase [Caballeronia hypogeia]|uniref:N-acyl-D-amino-acid deacylase n=1 Tax=Caballeronia hypogeia TaxID=1777140 RepID=A0A158CJ81_9BURK|nr:D-aminoacylase [Caballeronia hypogeia]SAK82385.1 N-acyl-D-amino-acid deacylase [Caballeronia hypogeia]
MTDFTHTFDFIIAGGTVIDGTRKPRFDADIGVKDGRIAAIGNLSSSSAETVFDARGKVVAPGFIDSHTHDDRIVLTDPDMACKVSQGVTTVITGNCGISLAPARKDMSVPMPLSFLHIGGRSDTYCFETFVEYLDAIRRAPAAVNVAALVGHTTLRAVVMDSFDHEATATEIDAMQQLLDEALQAGAIGASTGTFYPPAAKASTSEVVEVCRPLTKAKAVYATHMRDEADESIAALNESFEIGRLLNVPVVVSHHKLKGERNFGKSAATLSLIHSAMQCQCVSLDCYPYSASSTMLHSDESKLEGRVLVATSETHPEQAGRLIGDIANDWGLSRAEAAKRMQPGSAIYFNMDEGDVRSILSFAATMIGSDGLPVGDNPHPRLWGTFPRVLGHYSREVGLFPLETAVWKMSGLTARTFGLADRGTVEVGKHADLVIFDAATVRDTATYDAPTSPAEGIDAVFVNGALTWSDGGHTGQRNGSVIVRLPKDAEAA